MKAEEIKFEILGIPYTQSLLTEMVKTYARIQIEKDRERVLESYITSDYKESFGEIVRKTPIILD